MLSWRRLASTWVALGLLLACSKGEPTGRAVLGEEELGAPGAGGAGGGCTSDNDCPPGKCWQCNLTSGACEPRTGQVCANATGNPCDADDICDGTGTCVPTFAPSTTVCDNDPGGCNPDDHCTGTSLACPEEVAPLNTPCGDPTNVACDAADTCNATGQCQTHIDPVGTPCGDPTNAPPCNLRDTCNGNGQCLPNLANVGVACGSSADTECDDPDRCDGSGACLTNYVPSGRTCGSSVEGDCNHQDTCNGSGACLDNYEPLNTPCGDGATTACTLPDLCNAVGVCLSRHEPVTTPCDDGLPCTVGDHCNTLGACLQGTATNTACEPPCADLSLPGCCANWYCDPTDTDPVSRGCKFQALPAGTTACRPSRDACDAPELCDGTKDCPMNLPRPAGFQCQAALCTPDEAHPQVTCDGTLFTCAVQPDCDPYTCNGSSTACRTSCTTSAQCLDAYYCNTGTGRCEPRTPGGDPCDDASVCATPFCIDGVCCDARCDGQCEACNVGGREGVCSPVPSGEDPADYDNDPCDTDGSADCAGACDGVTTTECAYPPTSTECTVASCDPTRNEGVEASFCNGGGSCNVEDPVSCAPYACGADACNGDCTVDAHCDAASFCQAGMCGPRRDDGESCNRAGQCQSGFCVDSVCCESSCTGQCEACNTQGAEGLCEAVTGDPVGTRPNCAGSGDCQGACDGTRRDVCSFPGREVSCLEASCLGGVATLAVSCDGSGNCTGSEPIQCPKGCEGTVCAGDECVIDADCRGAERCAAGTCVPRGGLGTNCARGGDCASGHCTDGVCCESACLGQCEACDVARSEGQCVAVPADSAPHGARPSCTSDGSECAGACDGVGTEGCAYPDGNLCRDGSCRTTGGHSSATIEARCVGSGRCPAAEDQACPGACTADGLLCDGDCDRDPSACGAGSYCSAGVCVPERPTGGSCSNAAQCASGHCVDGFCCDSACDGRCEACDVTGSLGTCGAVLGAPHSGRRACAGTGLCAARCDGDGRDACVFPDDETSCGPESCSNGSHSEGQTCNGEGECAEGKVSACPAYECDGNRCGTRCEDDADCTGDNICDGNRCKRNPVLDAVDRGSCGCRLPGGRASDTGAWVALLGLLVVAASRRSRRDA